MIGFLSVEATAALKPVCYSFQRSMTSVIFESDSTGSLVIYVYREGTFS